MNKNFKHPFDFQRPNFNVHFFCSFWWNKFFQLNLSKVRPLAPFGIRPRPPLANFMPPGPPHTIIVHQPVIPPPISVPNYFQPPSYTPSSFPQHPDYPLPNPTARPTRPDGTIYGNPYKR